MYRVCKTKQNSNSTVRSSTFVGMFELDGVRLTYTYPLDPSADPSTEAAQAAGPQHYVLTPRCSVEMAQEDGCAVLRLTAQPLRKVTGQQLAVQQLAARRSRLDML